MSQPFSVLIVTPSITLSAAIVAATREWTFDATYATAATLPAIDAVVSRRVPDLIVLDAALDSHEHAYQYLCDCAPQAGLVLLSDATSTAAYEAALRRGLLDIVDPSRVDILMRVIARELARLHKPAAQPAAQPAAPPIEDVFQPLFVNNPSYPMWIYDLGTLAFLDVNDAAVAHYGYSRSEFLKMTLRDIRPAEDVPLLEQDIAIKRPTVQRSGLWRHQRRDGSLIYVQIVSHTLTYAGRRAAFVAAYDLTETAQAEHAVRQSNAELTSVLNTIESVVWSFTWPDRHTIHLSPAFESVFGRPVSYFLDDPLAFFSVFHPDDLELAEQSAYRALSEGYAELDHRIVHPDGSVRWVHRRSWVTFGDEGEPVRVDDVATDITAQKTAQEALRQSEGQLRSLIESFDSDIAAFDTSGRVLFANKHAADSLHLTQESLIGKTMHELFPPQDAEFQLDHIRQVIESGKSAVGESQSMVAGTPRWNRTVIQPVYDADGKCYAGMVNVVDITKTVEAEQKLRQSERMYRTVVESFASVIALTDLKGEYLYMNEIGWRPFGLPPEQRGGKTVYDLFPPDAANRFMDLTRLIVENDQGGTHIERMNVAGQDAWLQMTAVPIRDENGKIVQLLTNTSNITPLKQSEQALRESERMYRTVVESFASVIALTDLKGEYLYMNEIGWRPFGLPPKQREGKTVYDLFAPNDAEKLMALTRRMVETNESCTILERMFVGKQHVWLNVTAVPIRDEHGQVVQMLTNTVNFTPLKESEQALRDSEARYRSLIESFSSVVAQVDADGNYLFLNDIGWARFGVPPEQRTGRTIHDFFPRERADMILSAVHDVMQTGASTSAEVELVWDGAPNWFHITIQPVRSADGQIRSVLLNVVDITESKQAQIALERSAKRLEGLHKIDRGIQNAQTIEAICGAALAHLKALVPCERLAVLRVDPETGMAHTLAVAGSMLLGIDPAQKVELQPDAIAAMTSSPFLLLRDFEHSTVGSLRNLSEQGVRELLSVGLKIDGELMGMVHLHSTQTGYFTAEHIQIAAEVADQIAIAYHAAELNNQVRHHAAELEQRVDERTQELADALTRVEAILNSSSDGILLLNAQHEIERSNDAYCRMFDCAGDLCAGQSLMSIIHPDDHATTLAAVSHVMSTSGTQHMTVRAVRMDGRAIDIDLGLAPVAQTGTASGQIVCTLHDVTEQKRAQEQVAEERNLLRTLIDAIPDFIYIKDLKHRFLTANATLLRAFHLPSSDAIVGKTDFDIGVETFAPAYWADEDRLFSTGEALIDQEEQGMIDGKSIWYLTTKVPLRSTTGELVGLVGISSDLTKRKLAEQALRESEELFRQFAENMEQVVFIRSADDREMLYVNPAYERLTGRACEELYRDPASFIAAVFEADRAMVLGHLQSQRYLDDGVAEYDHRYIRADGTTGWAHVHTFQIKDETGAVLRRAGVSEDITERKAAEATLLESEERFRQLAENMDLVVFIRTPDDSKTLYINPAYEQMTGVSLAEAYHNPFAFLRHVPEEDWPIIADNAQKPRYLQQGYGEYEHRFYQPNGEIGWNHVRQFPIKDETGRIVRRAGTVEDITERKAAEATLRESEERFRQFAENMEQVVFIRTADDTQTLYVNPAFESLTGIPLDMAYSDAHAYFNIIPEEDQHIVLEHSRSKRYLEEGYAEYEHRFIRPDGSLGWVRARMFPIRNEAGTMVRRAGMVEDITERKRAEDTVRESEARYRLLADNIHDVIVRTDARGIVIFVSPSCREVLGYEPDELLGRPGLELIHPDDRETVWRNRSIRMATSTYLGATSFRYLHKDGHYIWIESVGQPVRNEATGEIDGFVTSHRDVTERHEMEEQLRFHASLQQAVNDAVIVTDAQGIIRSWNPAAERIYGWTASAAIGARVLDLLGTEYDSAETWAEARQTLVANGSWLGTVRQRCANGEMIDVRSSVTLLGNDSGQPGGMVGLNRDISQQRKAEHALQTKQEEERQFQTYLRKLHEATIELAQMSDLDLFYKRAVALGREKLGFERLALFLYDPESGGAYGTYGTDEHGNLIAEHELRIEHGSLSNVLTEALKDASRASIDQDTQLFTVFEPAGVGWNAAAVLWDGTQALGWYVADNAIGHQPATKAQLDIMYLYALATGTLLAQQRTRAALHDSEERFRLLVEEAPEAILICNGTGQITLINAKAESIFGYQRDELIGQDISVLVPPVYRSQHTLHVGDFAASPHARPGGTRPELSAMRKDGTQFDADIQLSYIKSGSEMLVMSFVADISQRKRAEEALQSYAAEVHDLYNNAPVGYHSLDADGIILQINDTELKWLGRAREDVVGKIHLYDFFSAGEPQAVFNANYPLFKHQGWLRDIELEVIRADGTIMTTLLTAVATYDDAGNFQRSRSTLYDISYLKQTERELQASQQRFQQIAENMDQVLFILSEKDETITYINPAYDAFTGKSREMLYENPAFIIEVIHPDDAEFVASHLLQRNFSDADLPNDFTFRFMGRQGSYRWAHTHIFAIRAPDGKVQRWAGLIEDITERQAYEDGLQRALDQEKELGELKSRFVSMASHEFRTPLAAILATTETLTHYRARMDDGQISTRLGRIRQQVMVMKDIMDEILTMGRIQAGRMAFEPATADLDALCRELADEFESQPEHRGRLVYACAAPVEIDMDLRLMRHIVSNLVSNALKYSPLSRPVHMELARDGMHAMLRVRDEGIGIPPDDLKRVFEPFHRARNVGTISGTGLGLSITHQAVELHGGHISIESKVDAGTTVTVSIPVVATQERYGKDSGH